MRVKLGLPVLVLLSLAGGFLAGAWWYATTMIEPPPGPSVAPITQPAAAELGAARSPAATSKEHALPAVAPAAPGPSKDDARCLECTTALTAATTQLLAARNDLRAHEERRLAREGKPVPAAVGPNEPRFAAEKIRDAVSAALTQSGVPGRLQGLDCSEWPCIAYGRIRGAEDQMEKLEGAKALAAYEDDILTVLLWAATDEAAREGPVAILPGRPEQSLFALAFYPRGLARPVTDNIDRRLRSRTADLWNTMSPGDETGR